MVHWTVHCVTCMLCVRTDMTAGDVDTTAFQSSGIDVTSIVDFVKNFIGKNVAPQPIAQKLGKDVDSSNNNT